MYGQDSHVPEPYLLYSSPLAHNSAPQPTVPAKSMAIQKPRIAPKHLHRGFSDRSSIWHSAELKHGSPLGCVLEEEEEDLYDVDDSKSVRDPGLGDSGYSSGSASSEEGEPDTPSEGFFPTLKQQMTNTPRFSKDHRKQQSFPASNRHDNLHNNATQAQPWPSFKRLSDHAMPHRPLVAEEPYLIYSTPSPTNRFTPPIERALIYGAFPPTKAQQSSDSSGSASLSPSVPSFSSSPFRPASNFYASQPQEPIKTKYTSSFDPFAGDSTAFSSSPGAMTLSRNNHRSRFA